MIVVYVIWEKFNLKMCGQNIMKFIFKSGGIGVVQ
jgi:hypothetical protein